MSLTPDQQIRILIVEDQFFARMGLTMSFRLEPDMNVVAEAACGCEAVDLFARHQPDVTVLDGQLPDMHGTDVAREIVKRHGPSRLLFFSVEDKEEDVHRAVSVGVSGYVTKLAPRPELLHAVRTVAAGKRYFSEPLLGKLNQRRAHVSLSPRELEVLRGMAKGWPNKIIASELNISGETVKTFVKRILEKLGVEDRTQAVMRALERGLLKQHAN
jgi:two-component system NarL family response regulator